VDPSARNRPSAASILNSLNTITAAYVALDRAHVREMDMLHGMSELSAVGDDFESGWN